MASPTIGIRLGLEGKQEVKAGLDEIAASGSASAQRLARDYERAGEDVEKALSRRDAAATKIAAIAPATYRSVIDRNAGVSGAAATDSGATYARLAAEFARSETAAEALRESLDPLYAATKRYETELRDLGKLHESGAIDATTYAAAVNRSERALDAASRASRDRSKGLSVMQRQTLIYTASDIVGSASSGASPAMIAMQQGPQVLQAFAAEEGGMAKLLSVINPTTVAITALSAAALAGAAAYISFANAQAKLDAVGRGSGAVIGANGAALEANAERAANAANISIAAAREVETAYVQMGGIGANALAGLTAITNDFAAATGQDAKAAVQQLGAAMQDPAKGAQELTARYGFLSQAEVDQIQHLVEIGDLYGAQVRLLHDLNPALDGAAEHARGFGAAFREVGNWISDAATKLGAFLAGASAAIPAAQRLATLQKQRADLGETFAPGLRAQLDAQIADARKQMVRETATAMAPANAARQRAADIAGTYQSDDRDAIAKRVGTLRAGIAAGGAPDQLKAWTEALSANQHALYTWMPAQEKASRIAEIDARIAGAKTGTAKAALTAEKERLEQAGKVITSADAEAQATSKGAAAKAQADRAGAGHAATLAREAAAQTASARAALDVAAAYLQSGEAGAEAEARRKALTAATKSGADVEAEVRRELALSVAEAAATGARSVSQLRQETAARSEVNALVASGAINAGQMGNALADEAALRDLTIKRVLAYKLGLTDAYEKITATIAAYRQALSEAHEEEAHGQALSSLAALRDRAEDARLATRYAGDTSGAGERAKAELSAKREADARGYSDADRAAVRTAALAATEDDLRSKRASAVADMLRGSRENIELMSAEVSLVGRSAVEHDRIVARLQAEQRLRAVGVDLASDQARSVIAAADAEVELRSKLQLVRDTMSELQDAGSRFVDDLTNPDGSGLKNLLKDVEQELIKLAAINPLKNLLTGGNVPTLKSVLGLLSGASKLADPTAPDLSGVVNSGSAGIIGDFEARHNAAGTEYWSGGMTWVGENGPELVAPPRGARISSAPNVRQMMTAAANDRAPAALHFDLRGAVVTQDLLDQMNAIGDGAAVRGSLGGAQMASDRARRARRRSLAR